MAGADVLVLPSAYEACPLVLLEAAATGLPQT
jgi:glycosyltransferase involved in cell wall biosynthesis